MSQYGERFFGFLFQRKEEREKDVTPSGIFSSRYTHFGSKRCGLHSLMNRIVWFMHVSRFHSVHFIVCKCIAGFMYHISFINMKDGKANPPPCNLDSRFGHPRRCIDTLRTCCSHYYSPFRSTASNCRSCFSCPRFVCKLPAWNINQAQKILKTIIWNSCNIAYPFSNHFRIHNIKRFEGY